MRKFDCVSHFNQHVDDVLTEENMRLLENTSKSWESGSPIKNRIAVYRDAATAFKIPNESIDGYNDIYRLVKKIKMIVERAWNLKQREIQVGTILFDKKQGKNVEVLKIHKNFLIGVEGRKHGVNSKELLDAKNEGDCK